MKFIVKRSMEQKPTKRKPNISNLSIFYFFASKEPFKEDDVEYYKFLKNLALFIVKTHLPLQFMKNVWLVD